ncbi:hypothetical protein [uncultured Dialister sp.]|uniref:hypothetical protein n=1 Tax=uncultured Dialister sp. TaxID=278064 RepID=UPI0025843438|nr:hypothetical protein [uncultured Dialister sp.]
MDTAEDRLMGYGEPRYDQSAKNILSDKSILAHILKSTVSEFKDASIEDIANVYIEGTPEVSQIPVNQDKTNAVTKKIQGDRNEESSPTEGWVTFDILFHAKAPESGDLITLIINVEAQKTQRASTLGYDILKRALYYVSRIISSQKEREFEGSDYNKIKKVYSIFICMDSPNGQSAINRYRMKEEHLLHRYKANQKSYDLLNVVMIYLSDEKVRNRLIGLLQLLFRKENMSGDERNEILKEKYNIHLTEEQREELNTMCNLSEGIVDRVTERVTKSVTDSVTKSVKRSVAIESVRNVMVNLRLDINQAMDALNIPTEMRADIRKALGK